jgi:hypothetical protein
MKEFNINGLCMPNDHYMVDLSHRVREIDETFVAKGKYFTINRARQYGKTTTLRALEQYLSARYVTLRISFEGLDADVFSSVGRFVKALLNICKTPLLRNNIEQSTIDAWVAGADEYSMQLLSARITALLYSCKRPVVLMIDEVDKSSDNQLFLSFLGLLRDKYLTRASYGDDEHDATFKSVILAGVYNIKNLKLRPEDKHTYNSPWNIAAPFDLDMSFSVDEIAVMFAEYEADHKTDMDVQAIAERIHWYTSGYPFLVSLFCKYIHDADKGWSIDAVDTAARRVLMEENTLFDDLIKNLQNNPGFANIVERIVLEGEAITYNPDDPSLRLGSIFGIFSRDDNDIKISNHIFSTRLMNYFISISKTSKLAGTRSRNDQTLFIKDGVLDFDKVLERFNVFMRDEYRDSDSKFLEREARRLLLGFIRPIINGTGNYFLEPEIRGGQKIDILVIYRGQEYIVEVKIWRGEAYENSGIDQLARYAQARHKDVGYLVSFCDLTKVPREGRVFNHNGVEIHEVIIAYKDSI